MPIDGHVRVGGAYREVTGAYVKVGGQWRTADNQYVKVNGVWRSATDPQPPCNPAGVYDLSAISGGGSSGGLFDLTGFAGCGITAVAAKISYGAIIGDTGQLSVHGDPSGTYYRAITTLNDWAYSTIYHDLGATAAAQFEAGTATGYTVSGPALGFVNATALRVTLV